ncbi:hypothetical protein M9458_037828, partial [Cirrhinus mrigala]
VCPGKGLICHKDMGLGWQMEGATMECLAKGGVGQSPTIAYPPIYPDINHTEHPQQQEERRKKMCLPSSAPQQSGKFHPSSKPTATDLHSSVEGTAVNSSTKPSQIAVTTSGTTLQTVETPTQKLLMMVRKDGPDGLQWQDI